MEKQEIIIQSNTIQDWIKENVRKRKLIKKSVFKTEVRMEVGENNQLLNRIIIWTTQKRESQEEK